MVMKGQCDTRITRNAWYFDIFRINGGLIRIAEDPTNESSPALLCFRCYAKFLIGMMRRISSNITIKAVTDCLSGCLTAVDALGYRPYSYSQSCVFAS
jgi:hypothetical protein